MSSTDNTVDCGCEGSCPACFSGEVTNHACDSCGAKFCPKCHGLLNKDSHNVGPCLCSAGTSTKIGRPQPYDEGIWYQSAVSGLWYDERGAAGDVSAIRINGELFRITANKEWACVVTSDGVHRWGKYENGFFCDFCGDAQPSMSEAVAEIKKYGDEWESAAKRFDEKGQITDSFGCSSKALAAREILQRLRALPSGVKVSTDA